MHGIYIYLSTLLSQGYCYTKLPQEKVPDVRQSLVQNKWFKERPNGQCVVQLILVLPFVDVMFLFHQIPRFLSVFVAACNQGHLKGSLVSDKI